MYCLIAVALPNKEKQKNKTKQTKQTKQNKTNKTTNKQTINQNR
jgi:hypothetical protein